VHDNVTCIQCRRGPEPLSLHSTFTALQTKSADPMKRIVPYKQEKSVPYHGAVPVAIGVRKLIAETPVGARRLMSAGLMVELLQEEGLPEAMANRLFSQVRYYLSTYLLLLDGPTRNFAPSIFWLCEVHEVESAIGK